MAVFGLFRIISIIGFDLSRAYTLGIYGQYSIYGETQFLILSHKMCEKHRLRSYILSNDAVDSF